MLIAKPVILFLLSCLVLVIGCNNDDGNEIYYSVIIENETESVLHELTLHDWPGVSGTFGRNSGITNPVPDIIRITWKSAIQGKETEAEEYLKKITQDFNKPLNRTSDNSRGFLAFDEREIFPTDLFKTHEATLVLKDKIPQKPCGDITISYIGNEDFELEFQKDNRGATNSDMKDGNVTIKDGILDLSFSKITDKGLDSFKNTEQVKILNLTGTTISDPGLKHLSSYPNLKAADLKYLQISGKGFENFKSDKLEYLNLEQSTIENQYLDNLSNYRNLEILILIRTDISDISGISNLKSLQILNLAACPISDDGLKNIGQLKNLEQLTLVQNNISDSGIKYLTELENLKSLRLGANNITDSAVQKLSIMPSLLYLELSGTNITDKAVEYLLKFPKLESVNLRSTTLSVESLKKLKQQRPNLKILSWEEI